MKKWCAIISLLFFSLPLFSQPSILWQKTIGGRYADELTALRQTNDGGYIVGGESNSDSSGVKTEYSRGNYDYWVVKIDSFGNILWQKTIGGNLEDDLFSIELTNDNGYILGGRSNSDLSGDKTENDIGGDDYWLVKLDSSGNIQWQKTLGGFGGDALTSVKQTREGGYLLVGGSDSPVSGDKTISGTGGWIIKIDSSRTIQWQKVFEGIGFGAISTSFQQTPDGGYIFGGDTSSNNGDYWIAKTDSLANIQWRTVIGGSNLDELLSISQTNDGGYIIGGSSFSNISGNKTENSRGLNDYWIVKINSSGSIQWQKTLGGSDHDYLYSVVQTIDGGYLAGGYSASNISGDKTENSKGYEDYWIVKLDASGHILWQKDIGGDGDDECRSLQVTSDGGGILGGASLSDISGDKTDNGYGGSDYWILKLSSYVDIEESNLLSDFKIYPNPSNSYLTIHSSSINDGASVTVSVMNVLGEIMQEERRIWNNNESINIKNLPAGIYLARLTLGNSISNTKFIKE